MQGLLVSCLPHGRSCRSAAVAGRHPTEDAMRGLLVSRQPRSADTADPAAQCHGCPRDRHVRDRGVFAPCAGVEVVGGHAAELPHPRQLLEASDLVTALAADYEDAPAVAQETSAAVLEGQPDHRRVAAHPPLGHVRDHHVLLPLAPLHLLGGLAVGRQRHPAHLHGGLGRGAAGDEEAVPVDGGDRGRRPGDLEVRAEQRPGPRRGAVDLDRRLRLGAPEDVVAAAHSGEVLVP
mmetsp:Transcript_108290/g.306212  ORF Transcript_108290/g.306212 Transcript_108290/m.306212 type:complete len:235 (-) Transcript_108290:555-1259(-)